MNVRPKSVLLFEARRALGMSRHQVGDAMGWSYRTIVRWEGGRTEVFAPSLLKLVPRIHPIDPELAEEMAVACGYRLPELGIGPQAASNAPSPQLLADSVVCAAADALKSAPDVARLAVLASFRRARELKMTVEAVEQAMIAALAPPVEPPGPAAAKKKKPQTEG